ncbi:MAG TPA: hypothetical protein VFT95_17510 [Micromonosporaceae bacterium]|nr:hypothetical protein [Micromonosporaceae bacterium]
MAGGTGAWLRAGKPIVRGTAKTRPERRSTLAAQYIPLDALPPIAQRASRASVRLARLARSAPIR